MANKVKARNQTTLEKETHALAEGLKSSVLDTLGKGGLGEAFREVLGNSLGLGTATEAPKPQEEKQPTTTDSGIVDLFIAKAHKREGAPKKKTPEKPESRQEAAMSYSGDMKNHGEKALRKTHRTDAEKVNDLKNELAQVAKSAEQRTKVAPVILNQDTRKVGKSDIGFLQLALRSIKEKPEDANSWLNVGKKKNGSKKGNMDLTQGKNHVTGERTTVQNTAG